MSASSNSNNVADPTVGGAGTKTPVTSTQPAVPVSVTSTTSSRVPPTSSHSHIVKESSRSSQSPKHTTCSVGANAEANSSQRPSSSCTSATSYASQKNRKLVPRSRTENEDRQNKTSSTPVGMQQNQVITAGSSPSNNTYVIRDNEGRWFLLQTNAAPGAAVHQASQQQQFQHQLQQLPSQLIKPNFINGSATLGQLARSLAPKPPNTSNPGSSSTSSLLQNSSTNGIASAGSIRSGTHSSTTSASSSQPQPAVMGHYQALRPAANANPQLLTMINGYYVQQVHSNGPSASAVQSPTALVGQAKISITAAQPTAIANQAAQPKLRLHPVTSITPTVKQPQLQNITPQPADKWTNSKSSETVGTASPRPAVSVSGTLQNTNSVNSPALLSNGSAFTGPKSTFCSKAKGSAQSLTTSTIVSNSAQVMFMSNSAVPQSGAINGPVIPISCPGSQGIRQQLISGPAIPGQLLPVFQQQQNLPRYAPQQSSTHNSSNGISYRRRTDGDVELGVENKPPSIECHGESKEAHKVRLLFLREAQAFREKLGPQHEIVHSVDGLEILESDTPFPPLPPVPLEEWMPRGPRDVNRSISREEKNLEEDHYADGDNLYLDNDCRSFQEVSLNTSQAFTSSSVSRDNSERSSESKKKRKRKTNEVDRLLQMDFGPNEGRLRDIIENSDKNVEKKLDPKGTKVNYDSATELSVSPNSSGIEGKGSLDEEEEKPSSNQGDLKEKKRRGRVPGKKNYREVEESCLISDSPEIYEGEDEKSIKNFADKIAQESTLASTEEHNSEKVTKVTQADESANATETSLNSSAESTGELGIGVGNISLSDEDLDTERCIYCDGYLRVKRLVSHPQYCSKKCRKLWKKNPLFSGGRSADSSLQQSECRSASTNASSSNILMPTSGSSVYTSPNHSAPVSPDSQQRPARALILKMKTLAGPEASHTSVLCQSQDEPKSVDTHRTAIHTPTPRVYLPTTSAFVARSPQISEAQVVVPHVPLNVHMPSTYATSILTHSASRGFEPRERVEFPEGHPRTWSCDEVAAWVTRVTGTDTIGEKFRNQDVDGQSLLLMAESEGGIAALLTQKLLLKLGPVLKLEKALKDLIAKSNA